MVESVEEAASTGLTHLDESGHAHMVNVADKTITHRIATATGFVSMLPETLAMILEGQAKKGDVLAVARIAGIQGAKRTSELVPLCHPLFLTRVAVELEPVAQPKPGVAITAVAETDGKTGVEMEALTAVSVAALTMYDMCKAVDRWMTIEDVKLAEKSGGKSGHWIRPSESSDQEAAHGE